MGRVSPGIRSFNAGEFSELLEGRVDLDRYPASVRSMLNAIAAPQGPAICRSGTSLIVPTRDEAVKSVLIPFVFSETDATMLEFSTDRIRFMDEDGILTRTAPLAATVTSASGAPIQLSIAAFGAVVGDQIALSGFPDSYNLNGVIANVTVAADPLYDLDISYPALAVVNGAAARVYHVPCTYTAQQLSELRHLQSVDVVYLMTDAKTRTLSRVDTLDWRLEEVVFFDGPYSDINLTETTLTPSTTGNAIPDMTTDLLPSGLCTGSSNRPALAGTHAVPVAFNGRQLTYSLDASQFFHAFDADDGTYWASNTLQNGTIQYDHAVAFACDGYTIHAARDNQDTGYLANDYAPGTFTFEGFDGADWVVLDRREDYVLYDGGKSVFFPLINTVAYTKYRLVILKCTRNGLIEPRVRRLTLRSAASASITVTASAITGINFDLGFLATDVGRAIRMKGSDGAWRAGAITARASDKIVTVKLDGDPFIDASAITEWRLGYWSDTTGWPATGFFLEDRLWLGGPSGAPDQFAGSVSSAYLNFQQSDEFGVVLDDSAIVARLNSRKLSRIRWISGDARGLLLGTGSEEYAISAPNNEVITQRNAKAKPQTRRGSAAVEPLLIDEQLLFIQKGGRALREFSWAVEKSGYKSPSLSKLASHLGASQFVEADYAADPHSIAWIRRGDGTLVGLTYNSDENVVGWHRHDIAGGTVEAIAVLPQKDQLQDALWMVVNRTVDGSTRRYIEKMAPFWDFGSTLADAHYVDSALRYSGAPTSVVYGLQHLEGEDVYGLADDIPVGPIAVSGGSVTLDYDASEIILGLGFESILETPRLENGSNDGTAQGKLKRMNTVVPFLWRSFGGQIGVHNRQADESNDGVEVLYEDFIYPGPFDEVEDVALYTGMLDPIVLPEGYEEQGNLFIRRPKGSPLPLNVLALMPQLNTQGG